MAKDIKPGDVFLFYFTAHGGENAKDAKFEFGDQIVAWSEALGALSSIAKGQVLHHMYIMLDACYSGIIFDRSKMPGRHFDKYFSESWSPVTVVTAADGKHTAKASCLLEVRGDCMGGFFTRAFREHFNKETEAGKKPDKSISAQKFHEAFMKAAEAAKGKLSSWGAGILTSEPSPLLAARGPLEKVADIVLKHLERVVYPLDESAEKLSRDTLVPMLDVLFPSVLLEENVRLEIQLISTGAAFPPVVVVPICLKYVDGVLQDIYGETCDEAYGSVGVKIEVEIREDTVMPKSVSVEDKIAELIPVHTPMPEKVVGPTDTPTPTPTPMPTPEPEKATLTPTPTPTPTSTEAPPAEPQDVGFEAEDGQELVGTYYPPPVCPSPLTVVYYPWVHGDKDDVYAVAALLPEDVSYGALAITPRGCEGGGQIWDTGWSLDYVAALSAAKGLPCAGQSPIVTIGSSVGGDGAVYACGQEEDCVGALSISAGGYLDEPFADLVATMVEQGKYVWSVSAQDDPESARLDRPEWGDYYREIVVPGDKHGNQLFDASTGKIIHSFIECATHSFGSEECVTALTKEYVEGCNAYLEQGRPLLVEHEETGEGHCALAIDLLQLAIEQATAAVELDPKIAAAYFCRGMSRRWLEEGLNEAIEDLQRALDLGLEGDKRVEAETELERLRDKVTASICVTMDPPIFAKDWKWDEGVPIEPGTAFPANSTREVWARWTLSNPCDGEETVVKWYHDKKLKCQHYDKLEDWWDYSGSGWVADEEWIEVGQWCVKVFKADTLLAEGCFNIE